MCVLAVSLLPCRVKADPVQQADGHRYPLAPIQSSTLGTFTSRCPLPSPASHIDPNNLDRDPPVPRPPCAFTFVAVASSSAPSDSPPVVVVLASPTHSCTPAGRAARVRAERTQAAEYLVEAARAAALVERSAPAQEEQDDEASREAEEREREEGLEGLACRARELDEQQAWVEGYTPTAALPHAALSSQAHNIARELDELDAETLNDLDLDEDVDYASMEDRAAFEEGAGRRWRGDGGIDVTPGPRLAGASAPQASVLRAFKAPRRRSSPPDEEIPELE